MTVLVRADNWIRRRPRRGDWLALLLLTVLWCLFFWRVLTPNQADQVSLPQGDFSGQFLAFGAYQARRLLSGQVPLWNPYNYAGAPFLADTQAAVFYPPRLITILVSSWLGGWSYLALQAEVIAHYWLASVLTFAFVRAITSSRMAGLTSAIAFTYGGYLTGYPPLQVAVLEAGIWLPMCLLGIFKASTPSTGDSAAVWRPTWLGMSSLALGLSLLAGHPQTSLFLTYAAIAFLVHRAVRLRMGWRGTVAAIFGLCAGGYGLAAVQLIPAFEYTTLTTRSDIGFDLRAAGFPFSDLATLAIPNVFTEWSPLYVGIPVLTLALIAFRDRLGSARFWGYFALIALAVSFGGSTLAYQLGYLALPGLALFRDQERAVYLVAFSIAVMAGYGLASLQSRRAMHPPFSRALGIASGVAWGLAIEVVIARVIWSNPVLDRLSQGAIFLSILLSLTWLIFSVVRSQSRSGWGTAALVGLVVFDLFSNTIKTNWEAVPAANRQLLSSLVPVAQSDPSLFRVDGRLGLGENYGTLIGMQDIRGTSPLRLKSLDGYLSLPEYRMFQLLSVKYVFTDWTQLEIPSTVRAGAQLGSTKALLHEISQPLPRAWMAYDVMTTADHAQALAWIAAPTFDPLKTVILPPTPDVSVTGTAPAQWDAAVSDYQPEHIAVDVTTSNDGVLVISEMDYPGWMAKVDGASAPILDADAGLRAVAVSGGRHRVELDYHPRSFTIGLMVSLVSILGLLTAAFGRQFMRVTGRRW